uniref:Protein IQ-DOMAIN 31 n=1 Tax=Anthurium amnicola TaxID=1678845 RepID=A0A1D1Y8D7_9ARAE
MFWKPPPQPKKVLDSRPQGRHYAMETESGRSKRSVRKNLGANIELGLNNVALESEKPKRNLRKVPGYPADPGQENAQSELERVKRNLRKVSNSMAEASERTEVDTEKPKRSMQKVANTSDHLDQVVGDTIEKMQKAVVILSPETKNSETTLKCNVEKVIDSSDIDQGAEEAVENVKQDAVLASMSENVGTTSMPVLNDGALDIEVEDYPTADPNPSQNTGNAERCTPVSGEFSSKEEEAPHDNQKTSKRRASFSAKSEHTENGLQNTPKLPSYMATTESAKAKLRGQNSPRFGSDEIENNGFTRRHSLPSSTNGKLNSLSPRTQRLVQASGKGGLRSDRSLLSSRDGNDKPIHVEWRR